MSKEKTVDPQWIENQRNELVALHQQIIDGVANITSGEEWKAMLSMMAKMPTYSFNNIMLILQQTNGEATMPASFTFWKTVGRSVRKGEKALRIFAPVIKKMPFNTSTQEWIEKDEIVDPANIIWRKKVVGFKPAPVFDVAQTIGAPLPDVQPKLLSGGVPEGLKEDLEHIAYTLGYTVSYVDPSLLHGANGVTKPKEKIIHVRNDVSDAATVKTLIHEVSHARMHGDLKDGEYVEHRGLYEIEAESSAYIIAAAHGLDTSQYSFPYVAGWSQGDTEQIIETAENVLKNAQDILQHTNPAVLQRKEIINELAKESDTLSTPSKTHEAINKSQPACNSRDPFPAPARTRRSTR